MTKNPQTLTKERGENYGSPYHQFIASQTMLSVWEDGRKMPKSVKIHPNMEKCFGHAVSMILTKISRATHNPMHLDNWHDIQGYCETILMCIREHEERMEAMA